MNSMVTATGEHLVDIWREVAAVRFTGERATACTAAALAVTLAVTLAQWAALDDPWWAGISGLMASQATRPASVAKIILRIAGTVAGSALGYMAIGLFAYDHVALCMFLFSAAFIGTLGMNVSPHGYAWLLGGLTANMVVLMAMIDPAQAPFIAFDRVVEVMLGCAAAFLTAFALQPDGGPAATAAESGWHDLLGDRWPAVEHAVRCGLAIVLMPLIWILLNLPSLSQMEITATAVMAVPLQAGDPLAVRSMVTERSILRIIGCLLGGILGLFVLGLQPTSQPLWLLALVGGVWICAHVQASKAAISYAGNQAAVVFIVTMVQGLGPPSSIMPGVDRFVGILGGLSVLLLIGQVLWPSPVAAKRS